MGKTFSIIKNELRLQQSELFSGFYENLDFHPTSTFNDVSINTIEDWYNSIVTQYGFLNFSQVTNLTYFFKSLKYVLKQIDPKKLSIENKQTDETALLLWRESDLGISKLIFDEFGQITYMFNGNDGKKTRGVFDSKVDMEKLLYRFISK